MQSNLRTPDERRVELPIQAPQAFLLGRVDANAAWFAWAPYDDPRVDRVEFEFDDGRGWTSLGTVPAQQLAEPIISLAVQARYRVRARSLTTDGRGSDWTAPIDFETKTVTVGYIKDGRPKPFFDDATGNIELGRPIKAFAFYDADGDGFVPSGWGTPASTDPHALFPRYWDPRAQAAFGGARYAPGANVIVFVEFETWTSRHQPHFLAVHLQINANGWGGVMVGGDLDPSSALVLGSFDRIEGELSGQMPGDGNPYGALEGWFGGGIAMTTANNLTFSAQVNLTFSGLTLVPDSAL